MKETKIGEVTHYFSHINVAAVKITAGDLSLGDSVHIQGHTTDFTQEISSMQVEHQDVQSAKQGDEIGLLVTGHVREGDVVYKVTE
jgi:translation elongation factor EF-1alpha